MITGTSWCAECDTFGHHMGWQPIDRSAMGWGDGPPVWHTGKPSNPTEMYFTPLTDIRQARQAAKKAGVKMTTNDPAELCRLVLEAKQRTFMEDGRP